MPGLAIDVRLATEAELEAVTALLVAQLREHRVQTPEAKIASAVRGLLRHPERGRILVAVEGGRPVGVAAFSFAWPLEYADRSAWLEELYVEPAARGRGIGTRLLRAALRVAAEAGATVVDLEVEADHQRAARLYAREGFRSLARTHWVRTLEPVDEPRAAAPPAEITGGCFCGAVRYRVSATTRDVSHCHCSICRRTTGAPFVTWATFPAATFAVTAGSMDHPDAMVPAAHIWTSSQLAWLHLGDDLPRHAGEDPGERDVEP